MASNHRASMPWGAALGRRKAWDLATCIYRVLRISWCARPETLSVERTGRCLQVCRGVMSAEPLQSFILLAIGFAVAGLLSSGYQLAASRPASFALLFRGARPSMLAAVPFLIFAAPFIIMRNTVRGSRLEQRRIEFVLLGTVLAGFWSLMSGTIVVMALEAVNLLPL
jgi:hypothetical protein